MNHGIPNALDKLKSCLKYRQLNLSKMNQYIKDLESILQDLAYDSFQIETLAGEKLLWESPNHNPDRGNILLYSNDNKFEPFITANQEIKEILCPFIPQFIEAFILENDLEEELEIKPGEDK